MVDNPVIERMLGLIREQGKTENELADYIGLSDSAMSRWKYDGSCYYAKYIYEICKFLETTPNYLFFGPYDDEERLSLKEKEMLRMYRSLDDGRKDCFDETLGYLAEYVKRTEG